MKKIVVGSKNPTKLNSVKNVVLKVWPEAQVIGIEAQSGIDSQPHSDEEMIEGAKNRAEESLREIDADLGIGIEGGVVDTKHGLFLTGWVVAVDKLGKIGVGSGGKILLPEKISQRIREGRELGPVADKFFGGKNIKQKEGTVGLLTNNLLTRTTSDEQAVARALARFITAKYYK